MQCIFVQGMFEEFEFKGEKSSEIQAPTMPKLKSNWGDKPDKPK